MIDETLEAATKIVAEINGALCNRDEDGCEFCNCENIAREIIELVQRREREACAKVARKWAEDLSAAGDQFDKCGDIYRVAAIAQKIADDIRACALPSQDKEPK